MPVVPAGESRRTVTPNAVMTTCASPTQGGSGIAVWRVDMSPGATGPLHAFDVEQVWTVLDGGATVTLADGDGAEVGVAPGDTLVLLADVLRRITADPAIGFRALVAAPAGARATVPGGEPVVPAWIA